MQINPEYHTNKLIDPYYARIGKENSEPINNCIADSISEVEDAMTEKFGIHFCENGGIEKSN